MPRVPRAFRMSARVYLPAGFTLTELVFAMSLSLVLIGVALPIGGDALDDMRARGAARYLAGRIGGGRFAGIRTADIQGGIDLGLDAARQLGSDFRGVRFGLVVGIPDVDGVRNTSPDGVRIGTARILTMSPDGTATSGTLYLQCGRAQYAVRVLGATGRTRVLKYEQGSASWVSP